ncbi:MAG: hypothetical protein AAF902_03670, partial [Chloroflexota bacterium]
LGEVPESWLNAHQQQPIIDISFVLYPLLGMLSIALFIFGACIDFKKYRAKEVVVSGRPETNSTLS